MRELAVPGAQSRCIRVLLHWNTDKPAEEIQHVYIKGAAGLRPDRSQLPPVDWEELEDWIRQNMQNSKGG
jgi:chorismate mutase